jgi:hypothetical protein
LQRLLRDSLLPFAVDFWPILKRLGVEFTIQVLDALLQPGLCVNDRAVVDGWANFLKEIIKQHSGRQIADWLWHVLLKISFDRGERVSAGLTGKVDGGHRK